MHINNDHGLSVQSDPCKLGFDGWFDLVAGLRCDCMFYARSIAHSDRSEASRFIKTKDERSTVGHIPECTQRLD